MCVNMDVRAWEQLYTCAYTHTHTHTHSIYMYIHIYKKNKTSSKARGLDEHLTSFSDINPGIKKDHSPIKTLFTTKAETKDYPSHNQSPKEDKV